MFAWYMIHAALFTNAHPNEKSIKEKSVSEGLSLNLKMKWLKKNYWDVRARNAEKYLRTFLLHHSYGTRCVLPYPSHRFSTSGFFSFLQISSWPHISWSPPAWTFPGPLLCCLAPVLPGRFSAASCSIGPDAPEFWTWILRACQTVPGVEVI